MKFVPIGMMAAVFLFVSVPVLSAADGTPDKTRTETTYYPSPYGEYNELKATGSLTVPVKPVGTDTTKVVAGEIWFEQ